MKQYNKIMEYVMNTPQNTNPTILRQLIQDGGASTSWNDIVDKPFGTYTELEDVIPEMSIDNRQPMSNNIYFSHFESIEDFGEEIVGEKFIVEFNKKQYEVFGQKMEVLSTDGIPYFSYVLGNTSLDSSATSPNDSGEPFLTRGRGLYWRATENQNEITLAVYKEVEKVKQLESKFIENRNFIIYAQVTLDEENSQYIVECDKTAQEIINAAKNKDMIWACCQIQNSDEINVFPVKKMYHNSQTDSISLAFFDISIETEDLFTTMLLIECNSQVNIHMQIVSLMELIKQQVSQ